jgi:uracil-DNA glycosylase
MSDNKRLLQVLREEWHGCTRCRLAELRGESDIIFGDGPVPADIMLIGSHPTEDDENYRTPFTGEQGELLVELLQNVGIDPEECFRTHIVACRPKVLIPATEVEEERIETVAPQREDFAGAYDKKEKKWLSEGCKTRLLTQVYEVDPRIIITFGEVPLKYTQCRDNNGKIPRKMTEAQRELFELQVPGRTADVVLRYPVMAALDMGYLIKNPVTVAHGPVYIVMEALRRAKAYVEWIKKQEGLTT